MESFASDVRGRVLEVKEDCYTRLYGRDVEKLDILDIATENPQATIIADLSTAGSLPENAFDCFILTQTIHVIYELSDVIANASRTLKPGGVHAGDPALRKSDRLRIGCRG